MLKETVLAANGGKVIIMDSITKVTPDDVGSMVVAASHGGASSGEFALEVPLDVVILNDAGVGKDQAGIAALDMLQKQGVAGATVSHNSARIGDSRDMWECGIVSRVNEAAKARGLDEDQSLKEALTAMLHRRTG